MFGTRIVRKVIYDQLTALPAVTSIVGTRLYNANIVPVGGLPAAIYYAEQADYQRPPIGRGAKVEREVMRYVVRFMCDGRSPDPVVTAADAQLEALDGLVVDQPGGTRITFEAIGEVPLTLLVDEGEFYSQLGNFYAVEVSAPGA